MGDKTALRIDQIGLPARAHLDLGYHVPDELEIDLRDAHACVATRAGERQRHVGLGLPAKIDGSVVDLVRNCFGEFRILGKVGLACHHIHGQARDAQLLAPGRVELRELGDRRHLPQQPQPVEPPLIDGAGGPRQLRGPPHLALDLLDELADLGRRGLGLLALDADQGCLVLLKGEDDFRQSVGEQGDANDGKEQPDVFPKQPAAHPRCCRLLRRYGRRIERRRTHSITSSARAMSVGGTSRPVAFAVLSLITNSSLFWRLDGKADRAPRR